MCLRQVESHHPMRMAFKIGQLLPLHAGAGQRMLLAHAPAAVVEHVLAQPVPHVTGRTRGRSAIARELEQVRRQRFLVSHGEVSDGAVAVSVPVFADGEIACSLTAAGPENRCSAAWQASTLNILVELGVRLSDALSERSTRSSRQRAPTLPPRRGHRDDPRPRPLAYVPIGHTVAQAREYRRRDREGYFAESRQAMVRQLTAMNAFHDMGVPTFEYGNQIRRESQLAGFADAMKIPGFVSAYLRPLFLEGHGPFRWTCTSGDPADLARLDDLVLELFADDELVTRWITLARKHVPIEALPARVCYLGLGQRKKFGLAVNELVGTGEVAGPVAFSRDNLDSGSIINPTFESENMPDGSDVISDWPYLNGLLNASSMCDLIAIQANYAMGDSVHTGVTMIADGTAESAFRLKASLTVDSGIGVVRHAQAGYERAREVAQTVGPVEGLTVPLWWTREATFGPEDS